MYYGWALTYAGKADTGLKFIESAIARNPLHPGWYLWDYAFAHFVLQSYERAAEILEQRSPKTVGTYELLAMSYAMNGQEKNAQTALNGALAIKPDLSVGMRAETEPFLREDDLSHYLEAMRKAGFPD